ncbi:c2h2-type zinc finger transcription factor [Gigaspora margarita]|uniref:C2h2-type zinc finger transcription factor n=1 Tax=Gigaspora margarita TaxID=4874 RepID=A0A8H4ENT8_GIGMA|nr:c2h2-type zinc finger transcription factor [Gigaspora margarita]
MGIWSCDFSDSFTWCIDLIYYKKKLSTFSFNLALRYPAFWESMKKPSLIKFLEFRLRKGNLSDSKTEHRHYSEELDTITEYLSDSSPSSTTLPNAVWQWERTAFLLVSIMLVGEHYVSGPVTTTHKLLCQMLFGSGKNRVSNDKSSKKVKDSWELHEVIQSENRRRNESVSSLSDIEIVPNCPAIINDAIGLELGPLPRKESRWFINETDISERWHLFKEKSLELPKQHCPLIVEVFGDELLITMHEDIIQRLIKQETEFDNELLMKLVRIVKHLQWKKITRDDAVSELQILIVERSYGERAILKAIRNMSNKETVESKARKPVGRAKQPDAIINEIDQLSWSLSKGHGEAKIQEEMNNLYLLCTDLFRIVIFNKDAIDFYKMTCMLEFQVVGEFPTVPFFFRSHITEQLFCIPGHHITFYLTTLLCDALYVMVEVGHVDVPMSLEQVPAFLTSLDTLLIILNTYWSNCIMSTEKKEPSRRSTLATPSFKEMVSKSRNRHRPCQLRF